MLSYYQILEVSETATSEQIKKSFRRLAIKYHPDKNPNNKDAESKFKLVAEAYEILSDLDTKRSYDFKRGQTAKTNSSYSKQDNKKSEPNEEIKITPTIILGIFTEIRRKISSLDKDSVNTFALYKSLDELLSDINIHFLITSYEITVNNKIIEEVCVCCRWLEFSEIETTIIPKLVRLAGTDNDSLLKVYSLNKLKKKATPSSSQKKRLHQTVLKLRQITGEYFLLVL